MKRKLAGYVLQASNYFHKILMKKEKKMSEFIKKTAALTAKVNLFPAHNDLSGFHT